MDVRNVLIPVNLEEGSLIALEQATNVAKLFKLKITLLFVYEEHGIWHNYFSDKQKRNVLKIIETQLKDLAIKTAKESGCEANYLLKKGRISSTILDTAEEIDAKYIFMKTISVKSKDVRSISVNAFRVLRKSVCPVVSINGSGYYPGCRKILLPLDLSNETMHKITSAIEFASIFKSSIQVVSVVEGKNDAHAPSKINIQMNQVKEFILKSKIKCDTRIIEKEKNESIVTSILNYAKDEKEIDLIMIMTQQEIGITGAKIGATAQDFIKKCDIPLMTIRPFELSGGSIRSF